MPTPDKSNTINDKNDNVIHFTDEYVTDDYVTIDVAPDGATFIHGITVEVNAVSVDLWITGLVPLTAPLGYCG